MIVHNVDEKLINVELHCPLCKKIHFLKNIDKNKFNNWHDSGKCIQHVFTKMSATDREKMITGYCEECQIKIFGE